VRSKVDADPSLRRQTHATTGEVPSRLDAARLRPEDSWTVSTTAMIQAEAERAASLIEGQFPEVFAQAVDPRRRPSNRCPQHLVRECVFPPLSSVRIADPKRILVLSRSHGGDGRTLLQPVAQPTDPIGP
jgi:hypothetical protein